MFEPSFDGVFCLTLLANFDFLVSLITFEQSGVCDLLSEPPSVFVLLYLQILIPRPELLAIDLMEPFLDSSSLSIENGLREFLIRPLLLFDLPFCWDDLEFGIARLFS